ncbi:hypothetical protein DFJ67_2467 [Asanoa ferruginea]|uniref:BNR/Asp-box repeat protein n=1 Tax=Asanoa ferruginea TaxID=53367 RepID=A0A3D9ZGT3_9ACTN|nr:hypothetical protein [Asanoa ferruginea]REF96485.1 hypothetical protein DFJ67_2467 [Asanoa ferruginea]GIF50384.1 hypothetical protein Afe04nite_49230 [Asanoa ferruginea]
MRGRNLVAAAAAVLVLLGGCSIGDIRRPPPTPPPPTSPPATLAGFEVRHGSVPVPPSYHLQNVEFVNQALGYALFDRCGSTSAAPGPAESCSAAVVRTDDGGRSWHQVYHPHPEGKGHQLYAVDRRLVLHVDPDGWYVSNDGGVTYAHTPEGGPIPAAYRALSGEFQACCDSDKKQRVMRLRADGSLVPTKAQPPIADLRTVSSSVHWVYAVGLVEGRPETWVSNDAGDTWRQVAVGGASGRLEAVHIDVDRGGTFAWMTGQTDLISWPSLFYFDGQGWRAMTASGHPDRFISGVVLEDASLAVTTPDRAGLVSGGLFQWVDWPISDCFLRLLADGTLFCAAGPVSWLGVAFGGKWTWIKVLVGNE